MYYATETDAGWEGYGISYDKVLYDGKYYQVKFKCQYAPWLIADGVDVNWPINTQYATLTKKNIHGKEYWSIVKTSKTPDIDFDVYYQNQNEIEWKQLYVDYLKKLDKKYPVETKCQLAYINDDDIPELIANYSSSMSSDDGVICTINNGKIQKLTTWSYGISYFERKNLFCNSGGWNYMDDGIYKIENGKFIQTNYGHYHYGISGNEFFWNDKEVSEAQYKKNLNKVFDKSKAIDPYETAVSADVMISRIQNDFYKIYSAY